MKTTKFKEIYTVYKLTNTVNGREYIGCTEQRFDKRIGRHRIDLRRGEHVNKEMQLDYNTKQWKREVEILATFNNYRDAADYETAQINLADNPYNVAKNTTAKPRSYATHPNRDYVYLEAALLMDEFSYTTRQVVGALGLSPSTISKIRNNNVTIKYADTSFIFTYTDKDTDLFTQKGYEAEFYKFYSDAAKLQNAATQLAIA